MITEEIKQIRNEVKEKTPLIHCITNPISINQCANAVLSVGARPIMAEHPKEAGEITKSADALVLNLGNITDVRIKSMKISARAAKKRGIPIVLDAVGVACSKIRREFAKKIIKRYHPEVIKGNYSEINALFYDSYKSSGVDADIMLNKNETGNVAIKLARRHNCIILASGKTDIVTDGEKIIYIHNGTPQLAAVTGTGCMLGVLAACYLSVCMDIKSAATACAVLGIGGELSVSEKGGGSFMLNLMDRLFSLTDEDIEKYLKMEVKNIEKI